MGGFGVNDCFYLKSDMISMKLTNSILKKVMFNTEYYYMTDPDLPQ